LHEEAEEDDDESGSKSLKLVGNIVEKNKKVLENMR